MAKLYGNIAASALLTLDKSFARALGQPLDSTEVYYSKAAALEYAAGANAYVGQKLVVIENGVVSHWSVEDTNGTLKELGSKPVADGTTVSIDENGKITLANISDKAEGTYNAVLVNGVLTWVKPSSTTVEGLSDLITALTGRVDALETKVGAAAAEGVAATGLYKAIEDALAAAKAYADENDDDTIYNDSELRGRIEELEKFFAVADEDSLNEALDTLIEIQKEIAADDASAAAMLASIQAAEAAIEKLNGDVNTAGSVDKKIADAIAAIPPTDLSDYVTNDTLNGKGYAVASDVANTYATKTELEPVATAASNAATKADNLESRINDIVATGGEPNAINTIKVNGVAQSIDEQKAVNIAVPTKFSDITDNSGFDGRITAAQNQANKGVSDASAAQTTANEAKDAAEANAQSIGGLTSTVSGHTTTIGEHGTAIKALQDADLAHKGEYDSLAEIVGGHTTAIAGKASTTALNEALGSIGTNTSAINTINTVSLPAINESIAKKANSADVYDKNAIDALIGTPAEGKTIVKMIEDAQKAAIYDDTTIKASIKANTDALAILNGDAETNGSVLAVAKAEAEAAAKAEVAAVVNSAPEAFDTLKEIATWIEGDETATEELVKRVVANETAVSTTIPAAIENSLATAKKYTDDNMVKADDTTIANTNGTFSVKKVSTDVLELGESELVLYGGKA